MSGHVCTRYWSAPTTDLYWNLSVKAFPSIALNFEMDTMGVGCGVDESMFANNKIIDVPTLGQYHVVGLPKNFQLYA